MNPQELSKEIMAKSNSLIKELKEQQRVEKGYRSGLKHFGGRVDVQKVEEWRNNEKKAGDAIVDIIEQLEFNCAFVHELTK